jgi:hypothetical protein
MIIKVDVLSNKTYEWTEVGEWLDCLFYADGEPVLVELKKDEGTALDFIDRCLAILLDNFDEDDLEFSGIFTAEDAEILGYDTY